MTPREKEALLKRIYALPTEWADAGGSYGKGGPVGSEDAAMLWPEDVIDAINQFAEDNNAPDKQPDPDTGLVPCGCGGKAILFHQPDIEGPGSDGDRWAVFCEKTCGMETSDMTSREYAVETWNTGMGWRADK
jgi:hypothetical protein